MMPIALPIYPQSFIMLTVTVFDAVAKVASK